MASVNRVIILGHLGNDPDMRTMPNGDQVANISVATTESWTDKNTGEKRELTEWHRVVFFRRQAEVVGQYLRKGSQVYIEGRLRTRKWQDQNGQDRYTTEIQGDVLQMLGSKSDNQGQQPQQNKPNQYAQAKGKPQPQQQPQNQDFDDDIPF